MPEFCKLLEVTEQTYYRWRLDYNHHPDGSQKRQECHDGLVTPDAALSLPKIAQR